MYTACLTLMHHDCRKRMLAGVMHGACHVFSEAVLWTAQFDVFAQMPGACGSLRPHAFAALLAENLRPFAAAGQPMMMSGRPSAAACAALCGRITDGSWGRRREQMKATENEFAASREWKKRRGRGSCESWQMGCWIT